MKQGEIFKGTGIDHQPPFTQHADRVNKKAQAHRHNLTAVYQSLIKSVLTFNTASWYNFLTESSEKKQNHRATTQSQLSDIYNQAVKRKTLSLRTLHTPFTTPFSYSHQVAASKHLKPKTDLTKTLSFSLTYHVELTVKFFES